MFCWAFESDKGMVKTRCHELEHAFIRREGRDGHAELATPAGTRSRSTCRR
jgi:hypothetical protein